MRWNLNARAGPILHFSNDATLSSDAKSYILVGNLYNDMQQEVQGKTVS